MEVRIGCVVVSVSWIQFIHTRYMHIKPPAVGNVRRSISLALLTDWLRIGFTNRLLVMSMRCMTTLVCDCEHTCAGFCDSHARTCTSAYVRLISDPIAHPVPTPPGDAQPTAMQLLAHCSVMQMRDAYVRHHTQCKLKSCVGD